MSKKFELKYEGDTYTYFGDDFETATKGNKLFKDNKNKVKITELSKKELVASEKRKNLDAKKEKLFAVLLDLDLDKLAKDYKEVKV